MAAVAHAENLKLIKNIYLTLEKNFTRIYDGCKSEQQREQLRSLHDSARDAFWKATASALEDNNPTVASIKKDLRAASNEIEKQLKSLKNIVAFLKLLTEAVRLAGSLATLAAA